MLRAVRFFPQSASQEPTGDRIIYHYNAYNHLKATYELKTDILMLPISTGREYYIFDGTCFYVYEGQGEQDYKDGIKHYDFTQIDPYVLQKYLVDFLTPRDTKQRQLIKDFISVYDLNISKNALYLSPKGFESLENELLCGF